MYVPSTYHKSFIHKTIYIFFLELRVLRLLLTIYVIFVFDNNIQNNFRFSFCCWFYTLKAFYRYILFLHFILNSSHTYKCVYVYQYLRTHHHKSCAEANIFKVVWLLLNFFLFIRKFCKDFLKMKLLVVECYDVIILST